jgi:hypothetical protein
VPLITQSCPTEPLVTVMPVSLFQSRRWMSVATLWHQDGGRPCTSVAERKSHLRLRPSVGSVRKNLKLNATVDIAAVS